MNSINPWPQIDWQMLTKHNRSFFLYSESSLLRNLTLNRDFFAKNFATPTQLYFSMKSNPHLQLIKILDSRCDGFDVSSLLELNLLLKMGISPKRISFSGPGKTDEALKLGSHLGLEAIHYDSTEEVMISSGPGTLRLHLSTKHIFKLGFTLDQARAVLSTAPNGRFKGLHVYLGRESFSWPEIDSTIVTLRSLIESQANKFCSDPKLYIGPGLPIGSVPDRSAGPLSTLPIIFEVGRSLIASAGYYAVPVLSVKKTSSGRPTVIVDGGLNHLGSPAQAFHKGEANIPILVLKAGKNPLLAGPTEGMSVYGSLCLWHDCLVGHSKVASNIERGDWLVFSNCGSYGLSAAVPFFIGQPLPNEFLLTLDQKIENITASNFKPYHERFV